jgi:hypothetical protein
MWFRWIERFNLGCVCHFTLQNLGARRALKIVFGLFECKPNLSEIAKYLQFEDMANHWDTKCTNEGCGQRKGNHCVIAISSSRDATAIGHCQAMYAQMQGGYVKRVCLCKGFSDEKRWKDGTRIP